MTFFNIYLNALVIILSLMIVLWVVSIMIRNVSIADLFWGPGFIIACAYYFLNTHGNEARKIIMILLVTIWGLRLLVYLAWRNLGHGEDFRYSEFRRKYGEKRYWWISFFQTFLLQGILMWLISAPLLGAQLSGKDNSLGMIDFAGITIWLIGFIFESGGDLQLAHFRSDKANEGKVLNKGFWHYTRHPNYFGDSAVWWGYGIICLASGSLLPVLGSLLMTALIIRVSGVALLEKSLKEKKPHYKDYMENTSAFFPLVPPSEEFLNLKGLIATWIELRLI